MIILLVENDPQQLSALAQRLEATSNDVHVLPARSVDEARKVFSGQPTEIDAVIADMHFGAEAPEGGLDIVKEVATRRSANEIDYVPVIVLTGYADLKNAQACMEAGAFSYVAKSKENDATFRELKLTLARAIAFREAQLQADSMARAICAMVDSHEPYTGGHSERVAEYSRIIARQHDMSPDQQSLAWRAGLVHDLAKVGIDSEVLSRPARLPALLMASIRAHPEEGYEILRKVKAHPTVSQAVLEHHRRLDGSGYPKHHPTLNNPDMGQLSMVGQILGLADSFDAMTTPRPYMGGEGRDTFRQAIEKLRQDATTQSPQYALSLIDSLEEALQSIWDVFVGHVAANRLPLTLLVRNLEDPPSQVSNLIAAKDLLPSAAFISASARGNGRGQGK